VETRDVTVDVPAGVESGMSMQVGGAGAAGDPGMPSGDLFVEMSVESDPYFKRDPEKAEDVHVEVREHSRIRMCEARKGRRRRLRHRKKVEAKPRERDAIIQSKAWLMTHVSCVRAFVFGRVSRCPCRWRKRRWARPSTC
jgi:hypothetical protein